MDDTECHDCHHPIRLHKSEGKYLGKCEECNALVSCGCAVQTIVFNDILRQLQNSSTRQLTVIDERWLHDPNLASFKTRIGN